MSAKYYEALTQCAERYKEMGDSSFLTDEEYEFVTYTFPNAVRDKMPLMKLNRWLGYIQGVLIMKGLTSVHREREWTRPLFRPLDFPND